MYRKYHGFLHFLFPVLKANQPKTLVFTVFWQDNMQKNTMFSSNFAQFFSPCSSVQKTIIFYFIFATAQIAKLHLNSTFCLSQSLPQHQKLVQTVWAPKCCKLRCFMNVPCILPAKKPLPQTVLVCTYGAGGFKVLRARAPWCHSTYFFGLNEAEVIDTILIHKPILACALGHVWNRSAQNSEKTALRMYSHPHYLAFIREDGSTDPPELPFSLRPGRKHPKKGGPNFGESCCFDTHLRYPKMMSSKVTK